MWQTEMTLIVRTLIGDLDLVSPTYSDARIQQVLTVAGTIVQSDANLENSYAIDVVGLAITPDPTTPTRDDWFVGLTCIKSACLLDQSTFRTKAAIDGVRASLGSASVGISSNLSGFKTILDVGPCAMYQSMLNDLNIGNASAIQAILSPFVGNTFDPRYLNRDGYSNPNDLYG